MLLVVDCDKACAGVSDEVLKAAKSALEKMSPRQLMLSMATAGAGMNGKERVLVGNAILSVFCFRCLVQVLRGKES